MLMYLSAKKRLFKKTKNQGTHCESDPVLFIPQRHREIFSAFLSLGNMV